MRPLFHALPASAGLALLSGCAGMSGQQEPLLPTSVLTAELNQNYSPKTVASEFNRRMEQPTELAERERSAKLYRDQVAGIYMGVTDAKYSDFIRNLSLEKKGLRAGTDVTIAGLSAAGTLVSGGASKILSGITGGISASATAIEKQVYYDQTLPALRGMMDAERTKVRTTIFSGLEKAATEYPMNRLMSDLSAYERAGTIEVAIAKLTDAAQKTAATEDEKFQTRFATARNVGIASSEQSALSRQIKTALSNLPDNKDGNKRLDSAYGLLTEDDRNLAVEGIEPTPDPLKREGKMLTIVGHLSRNPDTVRLQAILVALSGA